MNGSTPPADEQRRLRATPALRRRVAVIAALGAVSAAASGCARGDRLDVSDPEGLVLEAELLSQGETTDLELDGEWPDGPTPIAESTLRVPFEAGAACNGGDSVEVSVERRYDDRVLVTIASRDNGTSCDDMLVGRILDVTFEPGVDIEAVRIVED